MNWRRHWHLPALLATGLAVFWAWRQPAEPPVVMSVKQGAAKAAGAPGMARPPQAQGVVLRIRPRGAGDEPPDAFPVAPWAGPVAAVAAPSVPVPAAPQPELPPVAPPLPFKLLGLYLDASQAPAVFLQLNDQNLVARTGDVLAQQYRVEELDDRTLTLVHLPTGQRQILNIGTAP